VSLIEEALRRQQEQERKRALEAPGSAAPAAVPQPGGPPPVPQARVPVTPPPTPPPPPSSALIADEQPPRGMNLPMLLLSIAVMLGLVGLAAGLTWRFTRPAHAPAPNLAQVAAPVIVAPVHHTNTPPEAGHSSAVASVTNPTTRQETPPVATAVVAVVPPTPPVATAVVAVVPPVPVPPPPPPPEPEEPWPAFTLKGLVSFGGSVALILGNGEILEVGEKTATGIQLDSATSDHVRVSFKKQTREYKLKAGTFVLLPPADAPP
jgi:hypothetical protein